MNSLFLVKMERGRKLLHRYEVWMVVNDDGNLDDGVGHFQSSCCHVHQCRWLNCETLTNEFPCPDAVIEARVHLGWPPYVTV
jgi:hypothetical protein